MLKSTVAFITARSKHPILAGLYITAAIFGASGIVVEQITGNGVASGFLVIYAMIAIAMGSLGYTALIGAKVISRFQRHADSV